jgi:methyl-accepting chemotaxis protein
MHELNSANSTGEVVADSGGIITRAVRYGILIVQLAAAGIRLRGLSEQVRSTYRYVEGCASSVDRLADQMAGLTVDLDTISEHRDAATVMRGVLAHAEAMAEATEDLAVSFEQTAAAHQADYGTVAEAARTMPVPMADASFYSNR